MLELDIRTIIFFAMFSCLLLTAVQIYYLKHHRHYLGAREWVIGSLCILLCYIFIFLRGEYLPHWTSIFIGNSFLLYGTFLRLNSSSLFVFQKKISRAFGVFPIILLNLWCGYFYFIKESIAFRSLGLMVIYLFLLFLISLIYFRGYLIKKNGFYLSMILAFLVFAIVVSWRAIYWPMHQEINLFDKIPFQLIFFCLGIMVDIFTTQVFIMMNNFQIAEDLHDLRTMIPVCAYCKSVRLVDGKWQAFELFLTDHTHKDLTHSLCPHCKIKFEEEINNC